jgi:hypothetical protein
LAIDSQSPSSPAERTRYKVGCHPSDIICQVQQELLACNCLLSVIEKRTDQGQSACEYTSVHEEHCCYCQQVLGKWRTESVVDVQTSECAANRDLEHNTISCHILKIGEGVWCLLEPTFLQGIK